ncbi:MAG: cupin domain-containing protein [Vicinamibacterales bacterium]
MTHQRLSDMIGGWFVGDFEPTCLRTAACEVACKSYPAGARESAHVHRVATELTVVASGRVRMAGREFGAGDIVVLAPGEPSDFEALESTITVVVKLPSVRGDKYPAVLDRPGTADGLEQEATR